MFILTLLLSGEVWSEFSERAHDGVAGQVLALGIERTAELASGTCSIRLWAVVGYVCLLVAVWDRGGAGRACDIVVGAYCLPMGL